MPEIDRLAQNIGAHLRQRRKEVFPKDTQSDVAERLGVSVATYRRMERGDSSVSFRSFLSAAIKMGCQGQFEYLFLEPDRRGLIDKLLAEHHRGD